MYILRFHKPLRVHAKTPNTLYTYCVGHRERWIARTAVDSGDTPWHFTARRTKFHCRQSPKCKWIICVRNMVFGPEKSQHRRAVWPLREGREIWGVDGVFASISWWRECVRGGVAPSANELAWFYKGFRHRSRRRRSQSVNSFSRSVSEPMIENRMPYPTTNLSISIARHSCHMTWSHGMMGCFVCSVLFWTWPDVQERQRAAWVMMMMCVCSWIPALSVWPSWPFAGPDQITSKQDQTAHLDEEESNHHNIIIGEGQTITIKRVTDYKKELHS